MSNNVIKKENSIIVYESKDAKKRFVILNIIIQKNEKNFFVLGLYKIYLKNLREDLKKLIQFKIKIQNNELVLNCIILDKYFEKYDVKLLKEYIYNLNEKNQIKNSLEEIKKIAKDDLKKNFNNEKFMQKMYKEQMIGQTLFFKNEEDFYKKIDQVKKKDIDKFEKELLKACVIIKIIGLENYYDKFNKEFKKQLSNKKNKYEEEEKKLEEKINIYNKNYIDFFFKLIRDKTDIEDYFRIEIIAQILQQKLEEKFINKDNIYFINVNSNICKNILEINLKYDGGSKRETLKTYIINETNNILKNFSTKEYEKIKSEYVKEIQKKKISEQNLDVLFDYFMDDESIFRFTYRDIWNMVINITRKKIKTTISNLELITD